MFCLSRHNHCLSGSSPCVCCLLSLLLLFSVQWCDKGCLGADLHLASVFRLFAFDGESAPLQGQDKYTALTSAAPQITASGPLPVFLLVFFLAYTTNISLDWEAFHLDSCLSWCWNSVACPFCHDAYFDRVLWVLLNKGICFWNCETIHHRKHKCYILCNLIHTCKIGPLSCFVLFMHSHCFFKLSYS